MASTGMAILMLNATAGCSAFRSTTQQVSVTCIPEDATLMIDGQRCRSPVTIKARRDRDISVQCFKDGYLPYQRLVGIRFNTTGVLDAIGTFCFLLPAIGLCTPGAWSLEDTEIAVTLSPK